MRNTFDHKSRGSQEEPRTQIRTEKPLGALTSDRILSVPQIVLDILNRRRENIEYEKVVCKGEYQDKGYL